MPTALKQDVLCRLVDGCELSKWPDMFAPPLSQAQNETWVKRIAVQLLDVSVIFTAHAAHVQRKH